MTNHELLTVAEMGEADRLAVGANVPSLTLMENAGRAVADAVGQYYPPGKILVLCGPGNNGGDGFVAARLLKDRRYDVSVALLGNREALTGDAAQMAKRWKGKLEPLAVNKWTGVTLVIDALFGAGLSRPLEGVARAVVEVMNGSRVPVLSIDVPSGLSGDSGRVLGEICIRAQRTVTFFRKKPGHLLFPGRALCGELTVADIGIPVSALNAIAPSAFENMPPLWKVAFPWPSLEGHKYARGHALVVTGPPHATGAARLAARAALRVGAGLVSVASPPDSVAANAAHLTAIMVKPFEGASGLAQLLADRRLNTVVVGPGCGVGAGTRALAQAALASEASVVLDADALTSFADTPKELFARLHARTVLTPHEGEFERLFPGLLAGSPSRLAAARDAAAQAGCVIILKGPDTVVASPSGQASINSNAPPFLATAGSGDVLAGLAAGLIAQGMEMFQAACAAVWLQGEAANTFGPGLISEDLPEMLPAILRRLKDG